MKKRKSTWTWIECRQRPKRAPVTKGMHSLLLVIIGWGLSQRPASLGELSKLRSERRHLPAGRSRLLAALSRSQALRICASRVEGLEK